jgi:hypothetical protein
MLNSNTSMCVPTRVKIVESNFSNFAWFNFINRNSECAVDATSLLVGSEIHQWKLHDRENQKWRLQPVDGYPNGFQIITFDNETQEEFALEIKDDGAGLNDLQGKSMILAEPNAGKEKQIWRTDLAEPGWLYISVYAHKEMVLDVAQGSHKPGAAIKLWTRHGGHNQQWRLVPTWGMGQGQMFAYLNEQELAQVSVDISEIGTRLTAVMEEHGFAVVDNVLSSEEVVKLQADFGNDLLNVYDRAANSNPDNHPCALAANNTILSAASADIPKLWPGKHSKPTLGASFGIPQGSFAWNVRLSPNLRAVYQHLHRTELETTAPVADAVLDNLPATVVKDGLVVGMDQVFFKPTRSNHSMYTDTWGHADLNVHCSDGGFGNHDVYQSIVSLWDSVDTESSTTVVWPGSHRTVFPFLMLDGNAITNGKLGRNSHFSRIDTMKGSLAGAPHFETVSKDIRAFYNRCQPGADQRNGNLTVPGMKLLSSSRWMSECYLREARRIPIKAGSMIIWSSRTIHQGWDDGRRLAMPVCWEPRSRRKAVDINSPPNVIFNRKVRIAAAGLVTTHWASLGREHSVARRKAATVVVFDDMDPGLVELATCPNLIPYSINTERVTSIEEYNHRILPLCDQLKEGGDQDENIVAELISVMRPEVVAAL